MFTDTKNLTNAASSSALELSFAKSNDKTKGKLRKVWKPLLRLITLKSSSKSGNGSAAIKHPNNVNLNNNGAPLSHTKDIYELSVTQLEDYAAVIRSKVATTEAEEAVLLVDYTYSTEVPTVPVQLCAAKVSSSSDTVISSASIEKKPTPTCSGCVYGRNCQHAQSHRDYLPVIEDVHLSTQQQQLSELPVHYIRNDDGTFFWTSAQNKIDDDLLNAWLCENFRQGPLALEAYVC